MEFSANFQGDLQAQVNRNSKGNREVAMLKLMRDLLTFKKGNIVKCHQDHFMKSRFVFKNSSYLDQLFET